MKLYTVFLLTLHLLSFYFGHSFSQSVAENVTSSLGVSNEQTNEAAKVKYQSESCPNSRGSHALLSRRKRALTFPEGTSFLFTISLVKALLLGIPLRWNIAIEIDIFIKTPTLLEIFRIKKSHHRLKHRQRREIWGQTAALLDINGVDGQACILRAICEAQSYLAPEDTHLVHDILRTVFSVPEQGGPSDVYSEAGKKEDCLQYAGKRCPFSLLQLLLSYQKA